ncbi:MAG: alpha/beta hydrolase [Gammaproteobacteria bacterium]|nr:MAG: alpha/beta hydrolase [Gammaproteobacteria bacterium]
MKIKSVDYSYAGVERKIYYRFWENRNSKRALFCLHGVTRNSRDFIFLAERLSETHTVICPDFPGRGLSRDVKSLDDLALDHYEASVVAIINEYGFRSIDVLGTSMGGMVSINLASKNNSPIRRLILNDLGAFVPLKIFQAIAVHEHDKPQLYPDFDTALDFHKQNCAGFGPMNEEQWREFTLAGMKQNDNGEYEYDYNPMVHEKILSHTPKSDLDLWHLWEQIESPVMILRGSESYALTREVAEEMQERGGQVKLVEFEGTGHAPNLMNQGHADIVRDWLSGNSD